MRSLAASLLCLCATASSAESETTESLREWLQEAPTVVRGREGPPHLGSTPETAAYRYTPFTVTEVLKGAVSTKTLLIREPADAPPPTPAGDEIVLLEDNADESGGYAIVAGASTGRYRVREGGQVQVNAAGLDAESVPAKDKRRHAANADMPLDEFRRITQQTIAVVPSLPPKTTETPREPPRPATVSPTPPPTLPKPPVPEPALDEGHGPGWGVVSLAVLIAAALTIVAWRRRR